MYIYILVWTPNKFMKKTRDSKITYIYSISINTMMVCLHTITLHILFIIPYYFNWSFFCLIFLPPREEVLQLFLHCVLVCCRKKGPVYYHLVDDLCGDYHDYIFICMVAM